MLLRRWWFCFLWRRALAHQTRVADDLQKQLDDAIASLTRQRDVAQARCDELSRDIKALESA